MIPGGDQMTKTVPVRSRQASTLTLVGLVGALAGCGGGEGEPGTALDTGSTVDATADTNDARDPGDTTVDSGADTAFDTTVADTGDPDTTVADTGAIDEGFPDISVDTSPPDTGTGGAGWNSLAAVPTGFAGRRSHSAVFTGTNMIVWGGCDGAEKTIYADGVSYDEAAGTWKGIKSAGLSGRYFHAAAWSGTEMLVIGGIVGIGVGYTAAKDGALYDPATDTWSAPITLPGPIPYATTAVWSTTTNEFLVWGGFTGTLSGDLGDGYAYKPSTKTWRTMSSVGAPHARNAHAAAWNGSKMILLGGAYGSGIYCADAFSYDPVTDKWETLTPPTTWSGRNGTTPGLASGGKVAFWGGRASWGTTDLRGDGLVFEAGAFAEIPVPSTTELPNPKREGAVGWWSADRVYVWGGRGSEGWAFVGTGASFDPAKKTWAPLPTAKAPSARWLATAVVNPTSGVAYVWGGASGTTAYADGARFKP